MRIRQGEGEDSVPDDVRSPGCVGHRGGSGGLHESGELHPDLQGRGLMSSLVIESNSRIRPGLLPELDYSTLCSMSHCSDGMIRSTNGPDGFVSFEGSIAHVRFSDGSTINVIPEGFKSNDLSIMFNSIFGLDHVCESNGDLFELLIMLFIRDVSELFRKGLKFAYTLVQSNESSFKGRMLFSENLRENLVHKERVFVEYELFSSDRAENRVIKTTLELLLDRSQSGRSKRDIKTILTKLDDVPSSIDIHRDLGMIHLDRNMSDYIRVVSWCRVFIDSLGLAGFSKGHTSFAVVSSEKAIENAFVARISSQGRLNGSFSAKCDVNMISSAKGWAVISVRPIWFYYDRFSRRKVDNAKTLYESSPGYSVIPGRFGSNSWIQTVSRICLDKM